MRGLTLFTSLLLAILYAIDPVMATGFSMSSTLAAFSSGPIALLLLAPTLVSASKGKPVYNSKVHPLPSTPFVMHKQNWSAERSTARAPLDRQFGANRGIVYQAGGDADASGFTDQSQIGWAYNWAPNHSDLADLSNIERTLMLWTLYSEEDGSAQDQWNIYTGSNAAYTHVLGYNEPDQPASDGRSSIAATDAASAWPSDMYYYGMYQTDRAHFYLGSPAIAAGSWSWMDILVGACAGCEMDFFVVRWYGECDVDSFTGNLEEYNERYMSNGQPMWVTEFGFEGCSSSCVEAQTIVSAIDWLESTSWIERYAYFGNIGTGVYGGDMCFLNSDKSCTLQGYPYVNADASC